MRESTDSMQRQTDIQRRAHIHTAKGSHMDTHAGAHKYIYNVKL